MDEERDESNLLPEEHISDEISERVRAVLSAAESAATAIRHEAEQQAQQRRRAVEHERDRYLENARAEAEALLDERMRRISELSDSIIEGAEAEAGKKPSPVERLRDAVRGENHAREAEAEQPDKGFEGDEMLAARLVALQMAVAGSARGEVEEQLRKTFALDDPAEILNDVFGAESKL